MYKSGLSIIPYPPLANEKFFVKLNTEIEPAIEDIEVLSLIFTDYVLIKPNN